MVLFFGTPGSQQTNEVDADTTVVTMVPENCDDSNNPNFRNCVGWAVVGEFLVPPGDPCTINVDCSELRDLSTRSIRFQFDRVYFNDIVIQPVIPVQPLDRLVVTMNFEVPE